MVNLDEGSGQRDCSFSNFPNFGGKSSLEKARARPSSPGMVRDLPRENRAPAIVPEDVPGLPGWGGPDTAADGARSLPRFNDCASALRPGEAEAIAALAAELNGNPVLADSYRSPVRPAPSPRLAAILRFVERTAEDLRAVRCADVRALRAAGLGTSEIVALARLVALVAYEAQILSTVWGAGDHR